MINSTLKMLFGTPQVKLGLNLTVRSGSKWAEEALPGDTLECANAVDGEVFATAKVVAVQVAVWQDLSPYILRFEHAPEARTMQGLKAAMDAAYGAGKWEGKLLTCVFFWVENN